MGWTFFHRDEGEQAIDLYAREFGDGRGGGPGVVTCATAEGTAYLAYRLKTGQIVAVVCLQQGRPGLRENFGYKDIDETMGPAEDHCPASILSLLTPVDELPMTENGHRYARDWRARCWARLSARSLRPSLKDGMILHFSRPIRFHTGEVFSELRVTNARKMLCRPLAGGSGLYRLNRDCLDQVERFEAAA